MSDITGIDSGPQGGGDQQNISDLLARIQALEEWQAAHQGLDWGNYGVNSPHPNQGIDTAEFGGGVVRLDPLTMQVQVPNNATGFNIISAVDQFQPTQAALDAHHPRIFYIVIRNGTSLTNQLQVNQDGTGYADFDLLDHPGTEATATIGVKSGSVFGSFVTKVTSSAAKCYPTDNVFLWVGGRTSDPTLPEDGMIWYRTDFARMWMRQNGVTLKVPFEFQTASATVITNGSTINTAEVSAARVAPGGAVTGIILQAGTNGGQMCTVINEGAAANTVTFAASGTSHVADGTSSVIAGANARTFVWSSGTSLWFPCK